jgi:hypothetical protein
VSVESKFQVDDDPKYGVVLRCTDAEVADQFEDFLSEQNFVLFNTKFQEGEVLFYFGQASSASAVEQLLKRFEAGLRSGE